MSAAVSQHLVTSSLRVKDRGTSYLSEATELGTKGKRPASGADDGDSKVHMANLPLTGRDWHEPLQHLPDTRAGRLPFTG
jgi:hypothetical protein